MLSLCYLPKAGRLTVTVVKGQNLKAMDITGSSGKDYNVNLVNCKFYPLGSSIHLDIKKYNTFSLAIFSDHPTISREATAPSELKFGIEVVKKSGSTWGCILSPNYKSLLQQPIYYHDNMVPPTIHLELIMKSADIVMTYLNIQTNAYF